MLDNEDILEVDNGCNHGLGKTSRTSQRMGQNWYRRIRNIACSSWF